jgi:flagellar basal body-associated protein FliL
MLTILIIVLLVLLLATSGGYAAFLSRHGRRLR